MEREEFETLTKFNKILSKLEPKLSIVFTEIKKSTAKMVTHVLKEYFETFEDETWSHGKVAAVTLIITKMVTENLNSEEALADIIDEVYKLDYAWKK